MAIPSMTFRNLGLFLSLFLWTYYLQAVGDWDQAKAINSSVKILGREIPPEIISNFDMYAGYAARQPDRELWGSVHDMWLIYLRAAALVEIQTNLAENAHDIADRNNDEMVLSRYHTIFRGMERIVLMRHEATDRNTSRPEKINTNRNALMNLREHLNKLTPSPLPFY